MENKVEKGKSKLSLENAIGAVSAKSNPNPKSVFNLLHHCVPTDAMSKHQDSSILCP